MAGDTDDGGKGDDCRSSRPGTGLTAGDVAKAGGGGCCWAEPNSIHGSLDVIKGMGRSCQYGAHVPVVGEYVHAEVD
jgi:hypothetical protein